MSVRASTSKVSGSAGGKKEISYLESESSRRNNGSRWPPPFALSSGITRGSAIDRAAQSGIPLESIRSEYRASERGCSWGTGAARRRGIGEFGHGLSITNSPAEFCPINLCSFPLSSRVPLPSSSHSPRALLLPLYSVRYLPIYLSIGQACPREHESSVNACQVPWRN